MRIVARSSIAWLAVLLVVLGCAPTQTNVGSQESSSNAQKPAGATHITAAILGDPYTLSATVNTAGTGGQPGVEEMEKLIHAGVALHDDHGGLRPQLGEAVPTLENGLWRVQPDGRMDMTWKIKADARWQDGTPVTASDLLFTVQVGQDKDLPLFRQQAFNSLDSVEALDARTVVAHWKEPYIWADDLFTLASTGRPASAAPLPRHLLEPAYQNDKARFMDLPYWTEEFMGAGPYRLREWARGSHLILQAFDAYVLGRPKIDEIEVRFIPDANTMIANILAGEVELMIGRGFSVDAGAELRDRWAGGKVELPLQSWVALYPQGLTPNPAIVGNTDFRRALLQAIDRPEMVTTIQHGLVPVADSIVDPEDPLYPDIERNVVKFPYDPNRAVDGITRLGFTRGPDGMFPIPSLEIRAAGIEGDASNKGMFVVGDYWKRIGLAVETIQIPRQRRSDLEYRATHPAFTIQRQPNDEEGMLRFHSREAPTAENNWVGDNKGRYQSAELDALIDQYFVTVPRGDRSRLAGRIVEHLTSQVVPLGLFYDAAPVVIGNRLSNVIPRMVGWNAHEWEAQP
jgi:peptide/nickel transport system substrate-binding protein